MKKLSVCVLVCALLLSACSITLPGSQEREDRIRDREKALNGAASNSQPSLPGSNAVSVIATTAPAQAATAPSSTVPPTTAVPETKPAAKGDTVTSVRFDYHMVAPPGYEYATIRGLNSNGTEVWKYTTEQYPIVQICQVIEIGQWEDRFYYIEGGTVTALDVSDGHILWQNHDGAGGAASVIGSTGNIYMTGYFGPDFIAIDRDGYTIKLVDSISSDYMWPTHLEVDESKGIASVYMSVGPDGYNPPPLTVNFR